MTGNYSLHIFHGRAKSPIKALGPGPHLGVVGGLKLGRMQDFPENHRVQIEIQLGPAGRPLVDGGLPAVTTTPHRGVVPLSLAVRRVSDPLMLPIPRKPSMADVAFTESLFHWNVISLCNSGVESKHLAEVLMGC